MRGAAKRAKNKIQRGLKATAEIGGRLEQKVTCNIPISRPLIVLLGILIVAAKPVAKFLQVLL